MFGRESVLELPEERAHDVTERGYPPGAGRIDRLRREDAAAQGRIVGLHPHVDDERGIERLGRLGHEFIIVTRCHHRVT
jgi:hypothetical protein